MKKTFFLFLILLLVVSGTFAQTVDKTVEKIRAVYTDVSQKAKAAEEDEEQGNIGELVMNELAINKANHQWRAVGIYQPTYRFFYKTTGESMYPETLVMVKVDRKISARSYYEEYLYNEQGALLFYFQKAEGDDEIPAERRVYFNLGKAVRIVEDGKTRERLNAADLKTAKEITTESDKIKDLFMRSIKL